MRFQALACDYDETLASNGVVCPETLCALERFKNAGKRLVLVTGRLTSDVPPEYATGPLFDGTLHFVQFQFTLIGQKNAIVSVPLADISVMGFLPVIRRLPSLLQRISQTAEAVVAARFKIVEGAIGMVTGALEQLAERDVVNLDEERKAQMVSNLLVVLCGDRAVQPVVNTGTLY